MQMGLAFAGLVVVGAMAMAMYELFSYIEKHTTAWAHRGSQAQCTLVTTVEPCAMCAGTQYWANIGRLVYGMTERRLLDLTGNHGENPTLDLPCRSVFAAGQKTIEVIGPVPEVEPEIAALHLDFWKS
jgi:tRNA(Arg) A34 adenosine deaminase TadA